ncbi:MAG: F0F1 ATP synthase subunit delta [Bacillota bacterium]|nr:F0F1 ATP synthase subunit delta [Bacillota bacterium]
MPLVEKRYAEALTDVAAKAGKLDEYQGDLQTAAGTYNDISDFRQFLLNPEVGTDEKKQVISKVFDNGLMKEIVNFLMLLLDKGRIKYLPGILEEYIRIADSKRNTLNMTIISATPLLESQINSIKDKYRKQYSANNVKAALIVDQGIMGGIKVQIGDRIIDGSVEGRLQDLKELLMK